MWVWSVSQVHGTSRFSATLPILWPVSAGAEAGEVVLSGAMVDATRIDSSNLERRVLSLKGKTEPIDAWVWFVGNEAPSIRSEVTPS